MRCYRCGGVMVYEKFYSDCGHFYGWKCISCGEIVDQVILENRRSHRRWHSSRAFPLTHAPRSILWFGVDETIMKD
jgi:hypothetical protein